jgi:hypothetical protein
MKALTVGTILVLLISAGVQTTLYIQSAFAADSNGISANNNVVQPGYLLTVYVTSHPFGTSTVGISITTEDGYTDQANIPTAGNPSWTFNIPPNQGNSVQVCVNSGALSQENCHTYKVSGANMAVALPAVSGTNSNTIEIGNSTSGTNGSNNSNNKSNHQENNHHSNNQENNHHSNNQENNHHSSNSKFSNHQENNHQGFGAGFGRFD